MNKKNAYIGISFFAVFIAGMFSTDLKSYLIKNYYYQDYAELVFKCDHAMKEHFIAKTLVADRPNEENASTLMQAEIALIDCQDYDLIRKKLLNFGLKESDLSEIGLLAIEEKAKDVRKVIEIHEIRYD